MRDPYFVKKRPIYNGQIAVNRNAAQMEDRRRTQSHVHRVVYLEIGIKGQNTKNRKLEKFPPESCFKVNFPSYKNGTRFFSRDQR